MTDVEKIKAMGFKPQEVMDTVIELMVSQTNSASSDVFAEK